MNCMYACVRWIESVDHCCIVGQADDVPTGTHYKLTRRNYLVVVVWSSTTQTAQKFGREGKSSTWSASAIPGSCADFLGRSSGGIERYQPCAYTHVITLSWMSVFIQTAPGEFAQLRGGTSTNLVATATSITGRILGQSFHFCAQKLPSCRRYLLQQKMKRLSQ